MEAVLETRRVNPAYAKLGDKREGLPAFLQRNEVVDIVRDNQVVLLSGETGCGKSTQVPQIILDSCPEAHILVMQPRKIAATTLADRIAAERCQRMGQDVGYIVPFDSKAAKARLLFTTLGVFRRRLLHDPDLKGITHVIFDEVHERDKLADFNMIFVRDMLERRTDIRVMLMSATLQMETFERYFDNPAKIAIPGRVFPVSQLYMDEVAATLYKQPMFRMWLGPGILCGGIDIPAGAEGDWNERAWKTVVFRNTKPEDRDCLWGLREKGLEPQMMAPFSKARLIDGLRKMDVLQQSSLAFDFPIIEALILHIDRMYKDAQKADPDKPCGTVLVFLPGWGDIDQLQKRLVQNFSKDRFKVMPLHSQVSKEQQSEIFEPPPKGIRKIVLTTNIAEASITVEGTEFVIDCGRAKEVSYDPYLKVGTLTTSWISQASAKQRAGRAGRTQGGLCFHLFCRERFDKLDEFLPPELLRSPLEDSALTAKLMLLQMGSKEKVSDFLAKAPSPPEQLAITNSIQLLVELGALTPQEELTALGEHLTNSPLPPRLAKTVMWAILLGCLDDALAVVSAGGGFTRDPFRFAGVDREEAQKMKQDLAKPHNSDHACLLNAVSGFSDAFNQNAFCDQWKLAQATMRQIRDQQNRLFTDLQEIKTESFANRNRGNFQLLVAVLAAGIFPNVARRRGQSDFYEAQNGKVEARPHGSSAYVPMAPDEWVFFQELSQMESTYKLKLVSPIDPLAMMLLCGEGPVDVATGEGKGGKGGKFGKGSKGGSQTTISLLDGWVKFRTDPATADQVKKLRGSLQSAFQAFCAKSGVLPPQANIALFDQVAAILSMTGDSPGALGGLAQEPGEEAMADGDVEIEVEASASAGFRPGMKRPAPWQDKGGGAWQRPRMDKGGSAPWAGGKAGGFKGGGGGKGKSWGKGGGGKGGWR
uniref:RNA helicase n=1 Tax=Alexandrium catenella TaxID=2925 RepID=A0A7S1Q4S2_ALECA